VAVSGRVEGLRDQLEVANTIATNQYNELKGEMASIRATLALILSALKLSAY